ncbi:MAG: hypothetical protein ACE5IY_18100 [bacterium]
MRKIHLEDPDFFRRFNAEYYARLNQDHDLTTSRDLMVDIIATVVPEIEICNPKTGKLSGRGTHEPWGRVVEISDPSHLKAIRPPSTPKSRCEWLWEDSAGANYMDDAAGVLGNFHEFVWENSWLK